MKTKLFAFILGAALLACSEDEPAPSYSDITGPWTIKADGFGASFKITKANGVYLINSGSFYVVDWDGIKHQATITEQSELFNVEYEAFRIQSICLKDGPEGQTGSIMLCFETIDFLESFDLMEAKSYSYIIGAGGFADSQLINIKRP